MTAQLSSMLRQVNSLQWASPQANGPFPAKRPGNRGAKAAGLRYERALAKALPSARHGQWFEFRDWNGHGWCQPDLLLPVGDQDLVVLEAKYTWTEEGFAQLNGLYLPIVRHCTSKVVSGVLVCKVLVPGHRGVVTSSLWDAIGLARTGTPMVTLHWPGFGSLDTRYRAQAPGPLTRARECAQAGG